MTQAQTNPDSRVAVPDQAEESRRHSWYGRRENRHTARCVLAGTATGFLLWWIVAEFCTADGRKVWWEAWWTGVLIFVILTAAVVGWQSAWAYRRWKRSRTGDEDDASLFWLVVGGIFASVVLASVMGYAQAELLTVPGESVAALEHGELLDIARATTFALAALGAVAVLLVNYRKQRSVEAALRHDQAKHVADLAHEGRKQRASEIAALHERYTKAVEQLANKDNPAIRLGGVHALVALGDDWAAQEVFSQRQACVDLLCSYLRSVPRVDEQRDAAGIVFDWEWDREFLEEDRDVRKAALEWLSRLATADAEKSASDKGQGSEDTVEIDLRGIALTGMDLSYAKLAYLKMPRADLTGARLVRANLEHADLAGARLAHAKLEHAVLKDVSLVGAWMNHVNATNAHFVDADLKGSHLEGADFVKADLTGTKLPGAQVDEYTLFIGATLDEADFYGVNVRRLELDGVDYSKAKNFEMPPEDNADESDDGSTDPGDEE